MRGDDAFAVLGLRPGAGRAEIDQAYRRLIKRYHPDYAGGDASRAADLNRAYSELRARTRQAARPHPAASAPAPRQIPERSTSKWRAFVFGGAAVASAVLLARSAEMTQTSPYWSQFSSAGSASAGAESRPVHSSRAVFSMDSPLATGLIDASVGDALRVHQAKDAVLAANFTRDCLSRLSANPSVPLFDSCAAYDEAIAILATDDPAFESGPFNPSAVTARQVGAARLLSADYFEAESRLQQIRSRVHLVLLPQIPDPGGAAEPRVFAPIPVQKIAELPVLPQAVEPPRIEPRRMATARQPVRRAAPRRAPAPTAQRPVAPAPAARAAPPWQQPMKPVWQKPLPPANR